MLMENMAYDSLNFARKLKRLGVPEKQADAHAQIFTEFAETNLATKTDIKNLEISTKAEFATVRSEIKDLEISTKAEFVSVRHDIEKMEISLNARIDKLDLKIDKKFTEAIIANGTITAVGLGLLFAALKIYL